MPPGPEGQAPLSIADDQDITSRKNTLDALEATQNRLEYLLTANPAVIYSFILTNNGYTLTFISRNVVKLTGFDPDEFLLDPTLWERCIHPEDSRGISSWVEALRQQGHLTLEYRFRHKDGQFLCGCAIRCVFLLPTRSGLRR